MAACTDVRFPELVELSQLSAADVDPLLTEETEVWRRRFGWDFGPSADLLRRFMHIRALYGYALRSANEIIGYAYYVCEGRKALIGDFYVREKYASPSTEMLLLGGMTQGLMQVPGIHRIESQLMLLRTAPSACPLPFSRNLTRHDRFFMEIRCDSGLALRPAVPPSRLTLVPWAERYQEQLAHLVSASYRGHIDSQINDQYRNTPGARQFLTNIVKFPGCGRFMPEASFLALDPTTGRICGMCLASQISSSSGHVTQLCVLPAMRGASLGYELLRQTLTRFADAGCRSVSLTVTCANISAVRLYESVGFRSRATFPALVWEGF
ncbi:MAG: GNAT family N-acetyltransferase [Acidobacteriaceae bacterium]|nr:GNAT family N-acetyltransferase [Acidobacteriaceae bacterium]